MATRCHSREELLAIALDYPKVTSDSTVSTHVDDCDTCRESIRQTRVIAGLLHSTPVGLAGDNCLDDDGIAALADGNAANTDAAAINHASNCPSCRARLAGVVRLMGDATVNVELDALRQSERFTRRRWSARNLTFTGLAAAAAAAFVLLGPGRAQISSDQTPADSGTRRETAITAAPAPRIVSPQELNLADSLQWTAVSQADIYRVRIWSSDGTVVWTTDTRATALPLPPVIQPGTTYLWEVAARIGWERWVSSEFVELKTLPRTSR